jgi:hypothetical protein
MTTLAKVLLFVHLVVIGAVVGAFGAFYGSYGFGKLLGASDMEGGLAMGAAGMMPYGALIGAGLGIWLGVSKMPAWSSTIIKAGGFGLTGLAVLAVVGVYAYQELTDGDPYAVHEEPTVLIEWRLPEAFPHDQVKRTFRHTMRSSYMNWTLDTFWDDTPARDEAGRTVLRLKAKIRWRVTGRIFQLWRAPFHNSRTTIDPGLPRVIPEPPTEFTPWTDVEGAPGNAFRWRVVEK